MLTRKQMWMRCKMNNLNRNDNNDNDNNNNDNNNKKKVRFNTVISVILIPELIEYPEEMKHMLWYNKKNYDLFFKEVKYSS